MKQSTSYLKYASLIGVKVQDVDVKADNADVQVQLTVDDQSLRTALQLGASFLGSGK